MKVPKLYLLPEMQHKYYHLLYDKDRERADNFVLDQEVSDMREWLDLNDDGEINAFEQMIKDEMLCTSREEHIALFGDAGDFDDDEDDDDDF